MQDSQKTKSNKPTKKIISREKSFKNMFRKIIKSKFFEMKRITSIGLTGSTGSLGKVVLKILD